MKYDPLPEELERGLLESVYEECMVYDLRRKGFKVETQVYVPIEFDGQVLKQNKLRIDMLVEDQVIVENKAVVEMIPLFEAQTLTYLRLGKMRLGYLINYNVTLIKNGIKRFVV